MTHDAQSGDGRKPTPGHRLRRAACLRWRPLVGDYVDGLLSPGQRAAMAAHLSECPECRAEVEAEHAVRERMRAADAPAAPDGLADRLVALARTEDAESARVWLAPGEEADLPSDRRARGRMVTGVIAVVTVSFALVIAVGWSLAPTLPVVAEPAAMESLTASAGSESAGGLDEVAAALRQVASSGASLRSVASPTPTTGTLAADPSAAAQVATVTAKAVVAQAAEVVAGAWAGDAASVSAQVCLHESAAARCADGVVRPAGTGLAMTLWDSDGDELVSEEWEPLAQLSGVTGWLYLGEQTIDGTTAVGIEAVDAAGEPVRRWWLGLAQQALVRVDSYQAGKLAVTEQFRPPTEPPAACPGTTVCPKEVSELPLVAIVERSGRTGLLYAQGTSAVVVLEQRGRLAQNSDRVSALEADSTDAQPVRLWQSGDRVFGVTGTTKNLVDEAMTCLPKVSGASGVDRVTSGLKRLTGR